MKTEQRISEKDRPTILKHFREQYEGTCELCGKDSEEAKEAKILYQRLLSKPIEKSTEDIESFYNEMADAVGGRIDEYYKSDQELIKMIRKYRGGTYE